MHLKLLVILQFLSFFLLASLSLGEISILKREQSDVGSTIINLLKSETHHKKNVTENKIAVGFGSCLDVMVPAMKIFKELNLTPPSSTHNFDFISSLDELKESFGYFFQRGASAGRYATNSEMFDVILSAALNTVAVVKLGGNGVAMSRRLKKEGASVMLMADVTTSNDVNQLDGDIKVAGETTVMDDIHLIFEYEKDEKWGTYQAPRANRFILYKSSRTNQQSPFSKHLSEVLQFKPNVLVVGGFRVLSQTVYEDGKSGLEQLEQFLHKIPIDIKTHVELSSFSKMEVLRSVLRNTILWADSLGMNEQELPNLRRVLEMELETGKNFEDVSSVVSETKPCLASVLDDVRYVVRLLIGLQSKCCKHFKANISNYLYDGNDDGAARRSGRTDVCEMQDLRTDVCQVNLAFKRLVSRIHVHTLAFQAIAIVKDHELISTNGKEFNVSDVPHPKKNEFRFQKWYNTQASATKSALTANRHTCGNETIDHNTSMLLFQPHVSHPTSLVNDNFPSVNFTPESPTTCWEEELQVTKEMETFGDGTGKGRQSLKLEICVAPVPVCKKVKQTVGGGDNVSAAGLSIHV